MGPDILAAGEVSRVEEELISSDIAANHTKSEIVRIASRKSVNQRIPDLIIREIHK